MENNYWIVDDLIIFKSEFNEELIDYYDIISKYSKIIFSNYNDMSIAIETNNNYEKKYKNKYVKSKFNKKIDLSKNINLTHLILGEYFNKEIDLSNNINLTNLTFGYCFNQEVDLSNNIKLTHLIFGVEFNKEIDLSKNINLTYLSFSSYFNQKVDLLNNINLTYLLLRGGLIKK